MFLVVQTKQYLIIPHMSEKIFNIIRILLIVSVLLNIAFHIGMILNLGVDIKYGVLWFSSETLNFFFRYLNIDLVFLLLLAVYLIYECIRHYRKH